MTTNGRAAAGWGSAGANFILLAAISASAVGFGRPGGYRVDARVGGHGWYDPIDLWRPFISNPGAGEPGPRCPGRPPGGEPFHLLDAPLPPGFATWQRGRTASFACVRLDEWGHVEAVRLVGEPLDEAAALVRTIRASWRFWPAAGRGRAGWQRVRLTRTGWAHEQF
jgi:hypothetical protein